MSQYGTIWTHAKQNISGFVNDFGSWWCKWISVEEKVIAGKMSAHPLMQLNEGWMQGLLAEEKKCVHCKRP